MSDMAPAAEPPGATEVGSATEASGPTEAPGTTEVGSYFVANYPPFSTWTSDAVAAAARPALATPASTARHWRR